MSDAPAAGPAWRRIRWLRHAMALAAASCIGLAGAQPADAGRAIAAQLAAAATNGASQAETAMAAAFYAGGGNAPAWTARSDVDAALALLDNAAGEGLEPGDYGAAALRGLHARRGEGNAAEATFDAALTLAMLRYLTDLHSGRTRGTVLSYAPATQAPFDAGAVLRAALAESRLATLPAVAAPPLAVYARLRSALQDYRAKAARGDTLVGRAARVAGSQADAPFALALRRRLAELGDLAPEEQHGEGAAADDLQAAVKRFQRRHGLREDGVAGPATVAALDVSFQERARQIAFSMERLRWLPALPGQRLVAINLPSYRLWAFDRATHGAEPVLDMRVIVGKAVRTPTPVFIGLMRYVEFNPYWNVPASILRGEILPRLARDPAYLARHHMEVVQGAAAARVDAATLAGLRAGTLRVRQRPGAGNALGPVKFGLPNPMNIYLHGTPARELFDAARRDFSHGCIRVEAPAALAGFVLDDTAQWHAGAIAAAMAPGPTRIVPLAVPVPVVIFYATAVPDTTGTLSFLADVYSLDAGLARRWNRQPLFAWHQAGATP